MGDGILMENPLTSEKARSIAEWLGVCDKVVLAMLDKDGTLTDQQREEARDFFSGHEMQKDLKGFADWWDHVSLR